MSRCQGTRGRCPRRPHACACVVQATAYRRVPSTPAPTIVGACPCPSPTSPGPRCCSARRPSSGWTASRRTSAAPTIWAKREDCNSGLAFGGNKVRKLEYLLADALAQGCDTLVSSAASSPTTPARSRPSPPTPASKCVLVQEHWVEWPDVTYDRTGNILMSRLMGADVRLHPAGFGIGFKASWEQALADVTRGRRQAVRDPGRRLGPSARRPRLRRLGDGGRASRSGSWASSSTRSSCAP